jgi:hypothetical protein
MTRAGFAVVVAFGLTAAGRARFTVGAAAFRAGALARDALFAMRFTAPLPAPLLPPLRALFTTRLRAGAALATAFFAVRLAAGLVPFAALADLRAVALRLPALRFGSAARFGPAVERRLAGAFRFAIEDSSRDS